MNGRRNIITIALGIVISGLLIVGAIAASSPEGLELHVDRWLRGCADSGQAIGHTKSCLAYVPNGRVLVIENHGSVFLPPVWSGQGVKNSKSGKTGFAYLPGPAIYNLRLTDGRWNIVPEDWDNCFPPLGVKIPPGQDSCLE